MRRSAPTHSDDSVTDAERRSGWRTLRKVAPYLWPEDEAWVKRRVVLALANSV